MEAIPQAELDAARAHGLTEADRLLRQDRQPMWASAHSFQDVKKRLKLSQQFVEAAQQARQEAEAAPAPQMPDQLKGKVLTATLKNGKAICPDFRRMSARTRLTLVHSECTCVPSYRSQDGHVVANMVRASATLSEQ